MEVLADLKVAILGSSHQPEGSWAWEQAQQLASWVVKSPGHCVIAAGQKGVAMAATIGVRKVTGVAEEGDLEHMSRIKVFTDFGEDSKYFDVESSGDEYFRNLRHLVKGPDIYVFFPGQQGTKLQLFSLLHLIRKGKIKMDHRRLILMCEHDRSMDLVAHNFWTDVAQTKTIGDNVPWLVAEDMSVVKTAVSELEVSIPAFVRQFYQERGSSVVTAHDMRNALLMANGVNHHTATAVLDRLVQSGQLPFPQTA